VTTACIVQARMTSTRLPGKVMYPLGGKPVIWHVLERCQRITGVDEVVLAVPDDPVSRPIAAEASGRGVAVFQGAEHNVLHRYLGAAWAANANLIMRITADCPLIDPVICARVLALMTTRIDYASNVLPRGWPKGLDCEVFTMAALERTHCEAHKQDDLEHVTPWMQRHLRCANLAGDGDPDERLVLDTPEDYEILKRRFAA
jgi:spore coat polysaccharide biosynthesis protein SpsF